MEAGAGADAGLETGDGAALGVQGVLLGFDDELGRVVGVGGGGGGGIDEFAHADQVAVLQDQGVPERGDELVDQEFGFGGLGVPVGEEPGVEGEEGGVRFGADSGDTGGVEAGLYAGGAGAVEAGGGVGASAFGTVGAGALGTFGALLVGWHWFYLLSLGCGMQKALAGARAFRGRGIPARFDTSMAVKGILGWIFSGC